MIGHIGAHGHIGGKVVDVDLADGAALQADLLGQGAQHIAAPNLFLASTQNLQGHHGRPQGLTLAAVDQVRHRVPAALVAHRLLNPAHPAHLIQAGQVDHQALLARAPGAA